MESTEFKLDVAVLKDAALILRAVNHQLRQQMLQQIFKVKKITVTEIFKKFKIEQSVASQHLSILRKAGFVNTERNGKFIYYSLNHERLNEVQELSKDIRNLKRT